MCWSTQQSALQAAAAAVAAAVGGQRGSLGAACKLARSNAARDGCLAQRAGRPSSPPRAPALWPVAFERLDSCGAG